MNFLKCSFNIHWFSLYQNICLFLQLLQIVRECFFGFFHENSLIKNSRLFFLLSWVREEKAVYQSHKGGKKKKKKVHSNKGTKICSRCLWILIVPVQVQRQQQHMFNQNILKSYSMVQSKGIHGVNHNPKDWH